MEEVSEVTELRVTEDKLACPHCGELQDGFYGDCRGEVFECEDCGKEYKIHSEADFEMY